MSNRKSIASDSEKAQGRVELLLRKGQDGPVKNVAIGKNMLSPANSTKSAYLAGQYMIDNKESPMGKIMITGSDGVSAGYPADTNLQRCVALLNNAPKTDKFINVYDIDGSINTSVVRGWGNSCSVAGGNAFLGANVNKAPKQSIRNSLKGMEVRHFFDLNKAIGTITSEAVMCGFGDPVTLEPHYGGFAIWKCLSRSASTSMIIPPGINGVTGVDELFIYNVEGDIPSYKVNLVTGAETDDSRGIEIFGLTEMPDIIGSFRKIDDKRLAYHFDSYIYILDYDDTGTPTVKLKHSIGSTYDNFGGFFELPTEAGYLYYSCAYVGNGTKFIKISLSDYSVETITGDNMTLLGGLPTKWTNWTKNVAIQASHGNEYFVANYSTKEVIVTTDLSNVCGFMTGTLYLPGASLSLFDISTASGLMYIGTPIRYQDCNLTGQYRKTDLTSPATSSKLTDLSTLPLAWINNGEYSNWYNYFDLSQVIDKTSSDTVDNSWILIDA